MKRYFMFGILLFWASGAPAQIPRTINYQGLITDSETNEPLNGPCNLTFSLFNEPSTADPDPAPLWTEIHSVELDNGLFDVKLGSVSSLDDIAFDRPYCLGILIGDTEVLPRQYLNSAAYSLMADDVSDGRVVKSINGLKDDISINAGSNISIVKESDSLTISAEGGGGLSLPYNGILSSSSTGFSILNDGTGPAGYFEINSPDSYNHALYGSAVSGGFGVMGYNSGSGGAGIFTIDNTSNDWEALVVETNGTGHASAFRQRNVTNNQATLLSTNEGLGKAGYFEILNPSNNQAALYGSTNGNGTAGFFYGSGDNSEGVYISVPAGNSGLYVSGGTKNAIVATSQGARALYTEESTEVWFTDYGFGQLDNGTAFIEIDGLFSETVSLDEPYHVFLEEYGDADLYVSNRTPAGFEVRARGGDEDVDFSYRIVAKRKGYENTRLEYREIGDMDPNLYPEAARKAAGENEEGNIFSEVMRQRSQFNDGMESSQ